MALSGHPRTDPYVQNYRIRFLPWMLTRKGHNGIRVQDLGCRQPAFGKLRELCPSQVTAALAASPQRAEPHDLERVTELPQARVVAGDSVVLAPAAKHAL